MSTRSRQFYAPYGDRGLVGVNSFLAQIKKEQIKSFDAVPRGRGTNVHITYEDDVPPRIEASSPPDNAWMRQDQYPTNIDLFFNEPVDPGQFTDDMFTWILLGSTVGVTAASISISEEDRLVSIPLPDTELTGYAGTATLIADGVASHAGAIARDRLQVGLNITDGHIPRAGEAPSSTTMAHGQMKMSRFFGRHVKIESLVDNFVTGRQMEKDEIIQIVHTDHPGERASEAFVLWYEVTHPRIMSVSPQPGANVAKEYSSSQVTIGFSEGLSPYYLKGEDGEDRVIWNGTPFAGTFTQEDDEGSIWTLSEAGLFQTEGVHTLFLRDLRNTDGDPSGLLAQYSWMVTPVEVASGGATESACEREIYTGDGIETTFTLTHTPISACDVDPYINGIQCDPLGWSLSGDDVIFDEAPFDGAVVWFKYQKAAAP